MDDEKTKKNEELRAQKISNLNNVSPEQKSEWARMGGIASGEARRKANQFAEIAQQLMKLNAPYKDRKKLYEMGFDVDDELTQKTVLIASMFKNAKNGNPQILKMFIDFAEKNEKKELELQKLREEIDKLKVEKEKLQQDMQNDQAKADAVQVMAGALRGLVDDGKGEDDGE